MSRIALLGSLVLLSACATSPLPTGNGNSLGMKFVRVPISGTHETVEFCIHETRECDIAAFRGASNHSSRAATHLSWHDANAFCVWLTDNEHREGSLPASKRYRLPTDHEWSCAVGIGNREDRNSTPEVKRQAINDVYPWGTTWPPQRNAGNYFGSEARHLIRDAQPIAGFADGQPAACEVMRFKPNALGLYDLGGNVWEWCTDAFRPGTDWRVLRGAAWNCSRREVLLSSHRTFDPSNYKSDTVGFRIVRAF
jgi:formylglycine-generating enzyme required for sulfatase activity